jgi:hypothetical protein
MTNGYDVCMHRRQQEHVTEQRNHGLSRSCTAAHVITHFMTRDRRRKMKPLIQKWYGEEEKTTVHADIFEGLAYPYIYS